MNRQDAELPVPGLSAASLAAYQPCTETQIRFQDCDPFGHLNNARYLDYFLNAREEHLADFHGLDIYERQARTGLNWVVLGHQIAYLAPVRMREKVRLRTCLLDFGARELLMEGQMLGLDEEMPRAMLWTRFAHFSLAQGRSLPHPPEMLDFLSSIRLPGEEAERKSFQRRLAQVRAAAKRGN